MCFATIMMCTIFKPALSSTCLEDPPVLIALFHPIAPPVSKARWSFLTVFWCTLNFPSFRSEQWRARCLQLCDCLVWFAAALTDLHYLKVWFHENSSSGMIYWYIFWKFNFLPLYICWDIFTAWKTILAKHVFKS